MAYIFKGSGYEVTLPLEEDKIQLAKELLSKAQETGIKLLLPIDVVSLQGN